ncbi:DNA-3-methyladenine glycosylase [Hymenobacter taeanensis]|uniref:Putative 3-methyladenine DNA glycosylase n=1 Tax=Hymenobacter taeanensis TaxID=2735321 RepID=A0A6M6BDY6_9BACT|nr:MULTISPECIES: DNA-3-methyladenine glycosylase [Hymenobacter]QJX46179.1 DNA-3-methyladenine glycosylase [Hymenobacter taeanensis]UOQ80035.1 DNA-3-methyladenine glycosylase [Hymenobacter sp. 5414T-23]
MKIPLDFYRRSSPVEIARELIGKYLFTHINGVLTGGRIVETEAYAHINDQACHSHLGRYTARTKVMYEPGGVAYTYLIYGRYVLFNIITNEAGKADAVLIRGLEPTEGIPEMLLRRNLTAVQRNLTAGPGLLTQALGITTAHYGTDLTGDLIWMEDLNEEVASDDIIASPRVGIDYAGDDVSLPWRFRLQGSKWVSPAK